MEKINPNDNKKIAQPKEDDINKITQVTQEQKAKIKKQIKKQTQPSFYWRYEDPIGFVIVFAVVGVIYYLNKRGNEMDILKNDIMDKDLILQVNQTESWFSLKANQFFEDKTLDNVWEYSNNLFSTHQKVEQCSKADLNQVEETQFNFYENNEECPYIPISSNGSDSYLQVSLSVIQDHICKNIKKNIEVSQEYLQTCRVQSYQRESKGGYLFDILYDNRQSGFVDKKCLVNDKAGQVNCKLSEQVCEKIQLQKVCQINGEQQIKNHLKNKGPLLGLINLSREFLLYEQGIFSFKDQEPLEGQVTVKIIGWGEEKASDTQELINYWIIQVPFGSSWGENGLAKIKSNQEGCLIEQFLVGFEL